MRRQIVAAAVRRPPDPSLPSSVEVRLADARNKSEIGAAMRGFDTVVNVIGAGTLRRNDIASTATAAVISAAQDLSIGRYIAMSAGMVALNWPLFKYFLTPVIFRNILAEHRRVEEIVRKCQLNWTILRPSALTNQHARGYVVSLELQPRAFMTTRADLATFIADELENNKYVRQAVFIATRRTREGGR
jgi:uncharacterized protein YbjT (DUF2867 family)